MFILNLIITIGYNLTMYIIQKIKHPLFEQFRVNNVYSLIIKTPWPW